MENLAITKEKIEVRYPLPDEMEDYYQLRHNVLRAPWNQPFGTERDAQDIASIHGAVFMDNQIVAVSRLQEAGEGIGQIRYMAVSDKVQGKGVGKKLLFFMEDQALSLGLSEMVLNARENAIPFYKACGYKIVGDYETLWGIIPHKVMKKRLV